MRYKVPQNIDMQDRIVGPLTMIQFMYLLVGGAICYAFFQAFSVPVFVIIALPVALTTLALAFFKVQDQPFSKFISSAIGYILRPKNWVWRKGNQPPETVQSSKIKV